MSDPEIQTLPPDPPPSEEQEVTKPHYTPQQMIFQASHSAGNLGHQSGVVPQTLPASWFGPKREPIDPELHKRFN